MTKLPFKGTILSIQPRIRLSRSFDEMSHTYLVYAIVIYGIIGEEEGQFSIGTCKAAHEKQQFKAGDEITGECDSVTDRSMEPVEFYKVSKLMKIAEAVRVSEAPPWQTMPPDLEIYRERGHRRLAARTYKTKCSMCIWDCRMPVEITIDHWNPGKKKYRFETFCYGP